MHPLATGTGPRVLHKDSPVHPTLGGLALHRSSITLRQPTYLNRFARPQRRAWVWVTRAASRVPPPLGRTRRLRISITHPRISTITHFRESSIDGTAALEEQQHASEPKPMVPSLATKELGAPAEQPLTPDSPVWEQHVPVTTLDKQDKGTKDEWVPRDPRLQRLTGRHPFNAEPSLSELMDAGFITPPSLHYVRNHGAVPKIKWGDHRLELSGMVDRPLSLTMDELVKLPSITIPVTIACSGNRRKELNMLRKSKGYNWGTSAVSTGYWTGVRLRDLLQLAGAKGMDQGAKFVWFRGPKGELTQGKEGEYGTSMPFTHAMDPAADVVVAYKHNGRWLNPDHGFPLRMVIPGWIGGRMVKWLSEIRVADRDTDSHYHIYDNRMLPSNVDEETADKEDWWHNRDTLVNEINVSSAISSPSHDEVIMLSEGNKPYNVKGYAYAGGGRRVVRVEISLDLGVTWRLAHIKRFEEPNAYGKYWCWVHWELDMPTYQFFASDAIIVRAWDEAMNSQPDSLAWNVMGIMNNTVHKVLIHPHANNRGSQGVRFQHPAPIERGPLGNIGWREEQHQREVALEQAGITPRHVSGAPSTHAPAAPVTPQPSEGGDTSKEEDGAHSQPKGGRQITMAELQQHNSRETGVWFVREGKVYDPTPFLDKHPGGADAILTYAGQDATEEFNAIHSQTARNMMKQYYIGDLVETSDEPAAGSGTENAQPPTSTTAATAPQQAAGDHITLSPREKVKLKLAERIEVNHDTRVFRFELPSPEHKLGLPVGSHVMLYAMVDGELVVRPYTPISSDEDLGHMDLLIKVYYPRQPNIPGGKMTQYLDGMKPGDTIDVRGPQGHFKYEGKGRYSVHGKAGTTTHLSMLAGGTGLTPMYQVIHAILKDKEDKTCISLLYANKTEADILMREELDKLAQEHSDRFKVWYVLDNGPPGWTFTSGRVTEQLMRDKLFAAGPSTLGLMCGPPGLQEHVAKPGYTAMSYDAEHIVVF